MGNVPRQDSDKAPKMVRVRAIPAAQTDAPRRLDSQSRESYHGLGMVLSILGIFSGWVAFCVRLLYDKWSWFHFGVNRIKHFLLNRGTNWEVTVEYRGRFGAQTLTKVQEVLQIGGRKFSLGSDPRKAHVSGDLDMMPLELRLLDEQQLHREEPIYGTVFFSMKLRANYRESMALVDGLTSLLERIEAVVKPSSCKYAGTVEFRGKNPYFGFFVRKLGLARIEAFNCVFQVPPRRNHAAIEASVMVSKERVMLSTSSRTEFGSLSRRYLLLFSN